MRRLILILTGLFAVSLMSVRATVTLPSFISDHMVLQQQENVPIWGWTDSKKMVTVQASWSKTKISAIPDDNGKWMVHLNTPVAGGPYEIQITDGDKDVIILRDILIGEVWYCSGQSNMEMPVKGFNGQPVEGGLEIAASARPSVPIRMCTMEKTAALTPQEQCKSTGWQKHTPEAVLGTSATAYFFALKLHYALDVPVGIIVSSWGGSSIISWIDRPTLESKFAGKVTLSHLDGIPTEKKPKDLACMLFNGQVAPLIPFCFRGILWYQGESNRWMPALYKGMQTAYVEMMRKLFNRPDAPFYFVQIAPYRYNDETEFKSGYFCEAQEHTLKTIPKSGMVPTLDIGQYACIHPAKKKEVGNRLAYLALSQEYGITGFNPVAPSYKGVEFQENGKATVYFYSHGYGLGPLNTDLPGFEIAGEDRVFHPAQARVDKYNKVTVWSDDVPSPIAIRYGFRNWVKCILVNNLEIPVLPFRTDNWDDILK